LRLGRPLDLTKRIPVVGVDMEEAERIGLIKIDALGLKTLSVLKDTIDINQRARWQKNKSS